jgi:pimeloyl-ACP methyl ester carboxylesterase
MTLLGLALAAALASGAAPTPPPPAEPLGSALEGLPPPLPVSTLAASVEGQDVRLAYMDLAPTAAPNGRAVLLLHGKNFWCDYWADTARLLAGRGFRVVIPDQLGFGRSSKPDVHYSFERLAVQTHELLEHLGVKRVAVVGHSMGGMLAVRFALMYPDAVERLVLENPIGLEDYREKVPYRTVEEWYRAGSAQTREQVVRFYQAYFARWSDGFLRWPDAAFRMQGGADGVRVARASALTYDMIYTQPVVHDLPRLRAPALLVIGQADRTAVGKALVPKEVAATLGDMPALGRLAAKAIAGARLVELPDVGHIPHLEAPEAFHAALLDFLR